MVSISINVTGQKQLEAGLRKAGEVVRDLRTFFEDVKQLITLNAAEQFGTEVSLTGGWIPLSPA